MRKAITQILEQTYDADQIDYVARVSESVLARLHFVVRMPGGRAVPEISIEDLSEQIQHAVRTWDDEFADALHHEFGEERDGLLHEYGSEFPKVKGGRCPRAAVADPVRLDELREPGDSSVRLHEELGASEDEHNFTCVDLANL